MQCDDTYARTFLQYMAKEVTLFPSELCEVHGTIVSPMAYYPVPYKQERRAKAMGVTERKDGRSTRNGPRMNPVPISLYVEGGGNRVVDVRCSTSFGSAGKEQC